ncbi:MAG: FAD-binding oxidoreductase [Bacteroidetes bacterium]|nr:FAD-binding oxidoreductase [Bacteroidota bacterium]HET6244399.1 FAD-binding oxidoreductase [Bacteroidia bacterium]
MDVDYLIVGQGIAGSLLAEELIKRNKKIIVIDNNHQSSSSLVAAGLYNPVVFKRFTKSWMADELIPFAIETYTHLEEKLKVKFHFQKNIIKVFASDDEFNLWEKRRLENHFMLSAIKHNKELENSIHAPWGTGEVSHAGNVNLPLLLSSFNNYLKKENLLINEKLNYKDIIFENNGITWKNIKAEKIIFCEGHKAINNPYFSWLPFKLTKGELLKVEINELKSEKVINKGVFILPAEKSIYHVGATYNWNEFTEQPTQEGKSELKEKLEKLLKVPYTILDHRAGIRPTVEDRRPLIGAHPKNNCLLVFNGMGTKGVIIAPYFASQFADFLTGKAIEIHKEADISRVLKKITI